MNIDINEVLAGMLEAMKTTFNKDWKVVKQSANLFIESRKIRFERLAKRRLLNEISNDFFLDMLEDEKIILISELHAIAIVNNVLAQNAANAAVKVLEDAIKIALKL